MGASHGLPSVRLETVHRRDHLHIHGGAKSLFAALSGDSPAQAAPVAAGAADRAAAALDQIGI